MQLNDSELKRESGYQLQGGDVLGMVSESLPTNLMQ